MAERELKMRIKQILNRQIDDRLQAAGIGGRMSTTFGTAYAGTGRGRRLVKRRGGDWDYDGQNSAIGAGDYMESALGGRRKRSQVKRRAGAHSGGASSGGKRKAKSPYQRLVAKYGVHEAARIWRDEGHA